MSGIRKRRHLLLLPMLAVALTAVVLATSLFSLQPTVPHGGTLRDDDVREIEDFIADNSPARLSSQGQTELSLNARELALISAFLFQQIPQLQGLAAEFELQDTQGRAWISIPASLGPLTVYLNLQADFAQHNDRARIQRVQAGHIPIPRRILRWVESRAGQRLEETGSTNEELTALRHQIRATTLNDGRLHIHLAWEPEALAQLSSQAQQLFLGEADRERLMTYYQALAHLAEVEAAERRTVSLQSLLPPLFQLAFQRSAEDDAVAENRSLLQVLSLYVNNLPIDSLLGTVPDEMRHAPPLRVTLYRRQDLTRHFVTSAALAASAGAGIAEVLANSKEVYDARHRSGFSFSDMTANVAGRVLGEVATQGEAEARRLQAALRQASSESDYIPVVSTSEDGLSDAEFADIFEDRTSTLYQQRIQEIEARVAMLPLYTHLFTQ